MVERADHSTAKCPRCGIQRRIHSSRPTDLCLDCKSVTQPSPRYLKRMAAHLKTDPDPISTYRQIRLPGGLIKWEQPPQPMTPDDLAWAEQAAEDHFWSVWERYNQADTNPLQREAERRARATQRRKREAA